MRIGILGSACDPLHKRHIESAEYARKKLALDKILLIPTNIPPHKASPAASGRARLEMARFATGHLKHWEVSDMEIRRRGITYTRDTIRQLKKMYPNEDLYWIVGSDAITSMPWAWKGGYDILDECRFVVVPRPGYPLKGVRKDILKKVIVLKNIFKRNISSTMVRNMLRSKKNAGRFLDLRVLRYIKQKKIYENGS